MIYFFADFGGQDILFLDECRSRSNIVALPFCELDKIIDKPLGKSYVSNPVTVGEQLRNRRLELRLKQSEVAEMLGVTGETTYNWENNRNKPPVSANAKIIELLGYNPFQVDTSTLAGKLKAYRYANGLSQEQAARALGLDETTINKTEGRKVKLSNKTMQKLRPITG